VARWIPEKSHAAVPLLTHAIFRVPRRRKVMADTMSLNIENSTNTSNNDTTAENQLSSNSFPPGLLIALCFLLLISNILLYVHHQYNKSVSLVAQNVINICTAYLLHALNIFMWIHCVPILVRFAMGPATILVAQLTGKASLSYNVKCNHLL
jgi:hypothetical protein